MSSIVYGALTRKRQEAAPEQSVAKESPGLNTYVDTLTALVPAEVLAAHAALLTATTKIGPAGTTVITHRDTLKVAFWILVGLSVAFYVVGYQKKEWTAKATLSAFIPPLAFIVWTAAQRTTAFDAVWPGTSSATREAIVILGALSLGLAASVLPFALNKAPAKGSPPPPENGAPETNGAQAEAKDKEAAQAKAVAEANDKEAAQTKAQAEAKDKEAAQAKAQAEAEDREAAKDKEDAAAALQAAAQKQSEAAASADADDEDAKQAAAETQAQAEAEKLAAEEKDREAAERKAAAEASDKAAAEDKDDAAEKDQQAAEAKEKAAAEAKAAAEDKAAGAAPAGTTA